MQAILLSLEPLFKEAEQKELWFFHESNEAGEVWFSPEYLRMKQSEGEYVWLGPGKSPEAERGRWLAHGGD
jgi:hypothetical protein